MMDIEKLIETLRQHGVSCVRTYGRYCSICDEATTALSTLQTENKKLRAEVESLKKEHCAGCSVPVVEAERLRDLNEAPKLRAELEEVKRCIEIVEHQRDAAIYDMTALMAGQCCDLCAVEYCNNRGKTEMCTAFKWCGPKED